MRGEKEKKKRTPRVSKREKTSGRLLPNEINVTTRYHDTRHFIIIDTAERHAIRVNWRWSFDPINQARAGRTNAKYLLVTRSSDVTLEIIDIDGSGIVVRHPGGLVRKNFVNFPKTLGLD